MDLCIAFSSIMLTDSASQQLFSKVNDGEEDEKDATNNAELNYGGADVRIGRITINHI